MQDLQDIESIIQAELRRHLLPHTYLEINVPSPPYLQVDQFPCYPQTDQPQSEYYRQDIEDIIQAELRKHLPQSYQNQPHQNEQSQHPEINSPSPPYSPEDQFQQVEPQFSRVESQFPRVESQFPQVQSHFPLVGSQFPQDEYQLSQVGSQFPQVEPQFPQVQSHFPLVGSQFPQDEYQLSQVGSQFPQVEPQFSQVNSQCFQHESGFSPVQPQFSQVESQFQQVETDFSLDQIYPQVYFPSQEIGGELPPNLPEQYESEVSQIPSNQNLENHFISAVSGTNSVHSNARVPRRRTSFSSEQLLGLEEQFSKNIFLSPLVTKRLSSTLNLSKIQIKNWFQNRRTREKKKESKKQKNSLLRNSEETVSPPEKTTNISSASEDVINVPVVLIPTSSLCLLNELLDNSEVIVEDVRKKDIQGSLKDFLIF